MRPQLTARRFRSAALTALTCALLAVATSCTTTTGGGGVTPTAPPPSPVDVSKLDPGHFPTTPQPQAGTAGSDQGGRLAEGHRMANYTVGPWQVDPALRAHVAGDAAVLDTPLQVSQVVWPWIAGAALHQPFLVGFSSERRSTTGPHKQLRNAVLRFADDRTASTVAQDFYDKTMSYPRVEDITPIVTEPEQSVPIPGHADAHGALLSYQQGTDRVQELTVSAAHGPFVLVQVIHCTATPDCPAQLAARTLDLQIPLLDTFTPTAIGQFAGLPIDPTGLVARSLPLPPGEPPPPPAPPTSPAVHCTSRTIPPRSGRR